MPRRSIASMGFADASANLDSIARKLNVSVSTVSRALRGVPGIHSATRNRIVLEARRQGYVLRGVERQRETEVKNILTLCHIRSPRGSAEFLEGISQAAQPLGFNLMTHFLPPEDSASIFDPARQPPCLRENTVDGIIFLHRWPHDVVARLSAQIPCVSVVHRYPGTITETVGFDDRLGMDLLMAHLLKTGARRIGFYGYCQEMTWSRSRVSAWMETMLHHRLAMTAEDVISIKLEEALSEALVAKSYSLEVAAERTRQGIQAWVCANDSTALSLCHFFQKRGIKVPSQVQLTGFHRQSHIPNATPVLTTVRVDSPEVGVAALRRLAHRFRYPKESPRVILLPCSLEMGETTLGERP